MLFAALSMLCALTLPAHATQICAWIVESDEPGQVRLLTLWLQSDTDVGFLYKIGGEGIVTHSAESNSPTSATLTLREGEPQTPWHYGAVLNSVARIDITLEIDATPTDIFSDTPPPLLAKFAFARAIPGNEKRPPPTLAQKQCATINAPTR
jgi:hypothetical protein